MADKRVNCVEDLTSTMTACILPTPLTDEALLLYLSDPTDTTITEHLKACAHCASRAQTLRKISQSLGQALFRADCVEALELGEYLLHLLPANRRRTVEQHLQHCPHCQQELKTTQQFLGLDAVAPPPPEDFIRRLFAKLLGASATPALALRGTATGTQMYQAEEYQIALEAKPNQLHGALISSNPENWTLELHQGPKLVHAERLDDNGGFFAENLPSGAYSLTLTSPSGLEVISFPRVTL